MSKISASVLAADVLHLGDAAQMVKDMGCDALHFDIMDGVFVPNLSFGPHVLKGMHAAVELYYDTHLMLQDPFPLLDAFAENGSNAITVHVEASNFERSLGKIRALGLGVGASLRPATPATVLQPFFPRLDSILVMTVEPGFGGQQLMPNQLLKISKLREMGFQGEIKVDGGVNLENARDLKRAGADTLVMGTSFFKAQDPRGVVEAVHAL